MAIHRNLTTQQLHGIVRWEFANEAARLALGDATSSDIYKVAIQLNDFSLWMLISPSPLTWIPVGGGIPAGGIIVWKNTIASIPAGWALCDGANGTPDLRDRFVVGAGGEYAVGATGGLKEVTLTTAQMPTHTHTASTNTTGAHIHSLQWSVNSGTIKQVYGPQGGSCGYHPSGWATWDDKSMRAASGGDHSHTVTVDNAGSGGAHENRPPYYALAYIMKL